MIQTSNDSRWFKFCFNLLLFALTLVIWAWLSGALYLKIAGLDATNASPLTLYQYWVHYGDQPGAQRWLIISAILTALVTVVPILLMPLFKSNKRSLFGDAKWATTKDMSKAGLFAKQGLVVGKWAGKYLTLGGSQHVLLAAPTRSGKGVGIVIPNMLNWSGSVVILDIKQENWQLTAGFRAHYGQDCYLLNPTARDYRSHCWNPLFYLSDDPAFRINDIQKIGQMIWPDIEGQDPIWSASCRSLFLGLVLYLLETSGKSVTMGAVYRHITSHDDDQFKAMIEHQAEQGRPLSAQCVSALYDYLNTADNTRTSIRKTFSSRLELWQNPVIDQATSANDFDLRELRKKPMSIYVGITPDDLERLAPLLNLFFQQVIDLNTRQLPEQNPQLKHQLLLLMDEFTALGKVNILAKGISYIAGYGIRMMPIIQSPAQLYQTYGEHEAKSFMENHGCRIVYAPKDNRTAKEISEELGDTTVKGKSKSHNRKLLGTGGKSESISDQRRALLLPQEVKAIGQWKEIILLENTRPVKCDKICYYKDKTFTKRLLAAPSVPLIKTRQSAASRKNHTAASALMRGKERPISPEDVSKLNQMEWAGATNHLTDLTVPEGRLSDTAINELADKFLAGFKRPI